MGVRSPKQPPGDRSVTTEEVRRALIIAARLVDLYGERALPFFERLERELIAHYRRQAAKERACLIAKTEDLSAYEEAAKGDPFTIFETIDQTAGTRQRS